MAHFRIRLPRFGRSKRPAGKEIAGMQPWAGVRPQPITSDTDGPITQDMYGPIAQEWIKQGKIAVPSVGKSKKRR